jgi:predicted NAD/FAD-dependent oxidoreductase
MAVPTVPSARVAVLGSGIAGSTAARRLAEAGLKVSVFECGFRVGGRTSTRITRDEHKFVFDHGAQYIGSPKTEDFRRALAEWEGAGFVQEWKGRVADVVASSADPKGYAINQDGGGKKWFVGFPRMSSICSNLLDHDNIDIVLQTRACAKYDDEDGRWTLTSHGDRKELGQFDWLICGDRLSATNNRADLRDTPLSSYKDEVDQIESVPILVLMIAFESPLVQLPYDGISFDDASTEFGSLSWIARDTSKPGRERSDGGECWIVQSGSEAAKKVLEMTKDEPDFEKRRELVREKAKELLLNDFVRAIQKLSGDDNVAIPPIVSAVGHRWSAAFPLPSKSSQEMDCFADIDNNFIACGDYVGKLGLPGRVEGAYVSGSAAAATLLDACSV